MTHVLLQMLCRVVRECLQESAAESGRMKAEFCSFGFLTHPPFSIPAEFQVLHRCVNIIAADGASSDDNDDGAAAPLTGESNGVASHERAKTREV